MKIRFTYLLFAVSLLSVTACHTRKSAGRSQGLSKNTPVPPSSVRQGDTTTRTPTPQFTPNVVRVPNMRPKPSPEPKAPVPPM